VKSGNLGPWEARLLVIALGAIVGLSAAYRTRDITFYHISDQHYGAKNFDRSLLQRTIDAMNSLPGTKYPPGIDGSVGTPRGVIMTGDLTDGGQAEQWQDFTVDWGLTGKDGRLQFPIYEMAGNHDGLPSTRSGGGGYVRKQIINRNRDRVGIVNQSAGGLHYSWDWDDVHFVCLNEYAGLENDLRYPGNPDFNRKREDYGNPAEQSLQFLAEDLAAKVGRSQRPVVLTQHYGFDDFSFHPWGEKASWWTEEHALRLWEVLEGYNVIAILSGHDGSEAAVSWHGILNQHMDDPVRFGVYHITDEQITVAKRNSTAGAWEEIYKQPAHVNSALPPELLQGPYLIYPNDPTKMKVAWRCNSNVLCTLRWGDDQFHYEDGSVHVIPYDRNDHLYQYTITDLPADTGVNFTLEIGGKYAPGMFYTPPAPSSDKVKFIVYGGVLADTADRDRLYRAVYDRIYGDPAYHTFLLHTGDFIADESRLQNWDRQFFSREPQSRHARYVLSRLPIMGAVRDVKGVAGRLFPYPYQAGGYYSFDYGPVHVVTLDPEKICAPGDPQYQWLKTDLESTPKSWKVVLTGAGSEAKRAQFQPLIEPLCATYGVDLFFTGQSAAYAQTGPHGTKYISLASAPLQKPGTAGSRSGNLHYSAITIDGDNLILEATSPDGLKIDSFTMKDNRGTSK
jgi:hypothetical protein